MVADSEQISSDPFLIRVLSPVTLIVFVALTVPGLLALLVVLSTQDFHQAEPIWIEHFRGFLAGFRGLPADITTLLAEVFPALAVAICFRRDAKRRRLSWSGRLAFGILLAGFAASIWGLAVIDPSDPFQKQNFLPGVDGLKKLDTWSEVTLRRSLTYLLLLTGLRIELPGKGG